MRRLLTTGVTVPFPVSNISNKKKRKKKKQPKKGDDGMMGRGMMG